MTSIDERVVEMRFENKDFESNVQTSLGTIEKLKRSLNFSDTSKSFDGLQDSLRRLSLGDVSSTVEGLKDKISATSMLALGFISKIGSALAEHVLGTLNQIKSALNLEAIDGIKNMMAGWGKYAEKTQSVATIMAATGESIDVVSEAMDRLNYFTDETSYDFADMTNNIGKWTANDVALDDASRAMQGIATWTARSGQNAATAGRVMYNLSQAIGMGALKLQDWKSVELANMGTKEFKEVAIQAGVATKTLVESSDGLVRTLKGTEVNISNFRETLAEGWLDKPTLMATLDEYGKAAELIGGIHEATGLMAANTIELAQAVGTGSLSVKDLGKSLKELGDPLANDSAHVQEVYEALKVLGSEEYEFSLATYLASQEARTFGDAMKSVADAVSTKWMNTFELIFGNYEMAKETWTDLANNLYDIFTPAIEARNALFKEANKNGAQNLLDYMEKIGLAAENLEDSMINVTNNRRVARLTKDYESFSDALVHGAFDTRIVMAAVDDLLNKQIFLNKQVETTSISFEEFDKLAVRVLKMEFGYLGSERQAALEAAGYTKEQAESIIKYVWARHELGRQLEEEDAKEYLEAFKTINKVQDESIELTDEQREEFKRLKNELYKMEFAEYLQQGLMNVGAITVSVFDQVREALTDMIPQLTAHGLRDLAEDFALVTGIVKDALEGDTFSNIANALMLPLSIMGDIATMALKLLKPVGSLALTILSPLVSSLDSIGGWLKKTREATGELNPFSLAMSKATTASTEFLNKVNAITKAVGEIVGKKLMEKFAKPLSDLKTKLTSIKDRNLAWLDNVTEKIKNIDVDEVVAKIIGRLRQLVLSIQALKQKVKDLSLFTNAADKIRTIFPGVASVIDSAVVKIRGFKESFSLLLESGDLTKLQAFFTLLRQSASDVFGSLKNSNWFDVIADKLGPFGDVLKNARTKFDEYRKTISQMAQEKGISKLGAAFDLIKEKVRGGIENLTSMLPSFSSVWERILHVFQRAREIFTQFKDTALEKLRPAKTMLQEFLSENNINVGNILKGGALTLIATKLLDFFTAMAKLKVPKEGILDNVTSVFDPITKTIEDVKKAIGTFSIVKFAFSMALLAYALSKLSDINPEQMKMTLGTLGGALVEFVTTFGIMSKIIGGNNGTTMIKIGLGMIAMCRAMLLFAKVLESYGNLNFGSIKGAVKIIGVLFLAVTTFSRLAKVAGKNNFTFSSGMGLVAAAVALWMFAGVLNSYAKLKNLSKDTIPQILFCLVAAIASFAIISKTAGKNNFKFTNGVALIAMAASLWMFAGIIGKLGRMDTKELVQGGIALAALSYMLHLLIKGIAKSLGGQNGFSFKTSLTTLMMMISIVIGLGALVAVLNVVKPRKEDDGFWQGMLRTLAIVGLVVGSIWLLTKSVKDLKLGQAIGAFIMMIGFAALLVEFASIMTVFSVFSAEQIGKAVLAMLPIIGALFGIGYIMQHTSTIKLAAAAIGMVALAGAIWVGMMAIERLASIPDKKEALKGLGLLAALLGEFALLALATMFPPFAFAELGALIILTEFSKILITFVNELSRLAGMDSKNALKGVNNLKRMLNIFWDIAKKLKSDSTLYNRALESSYLVKNFGESLEALCKDVAMLGETDALRATQSLIVLHMLINTIKDLANDIQEDETLFKRSITASALAQTFGESLQALCADVISLSIADPQVALDSIKTIDKLIATLITLATKVQNNEKLYANGIKASVLAETFGTSLEALVKDTVTLGTNADTTASLESVKTVDALIATMVSLASLLVGNDALFNAAKNAATVAGQFGAGLEQLSKDVVILGENPSVGVSKNSVPVIQQLIDLMIDLATKLVEGQLTLESAKDATTVAGEFGEALGPLCEQLQILGTTPPENAAANVQTMNDIITKMSELATSITENEAYFNAATLASQAVEKFGESLRPLVWLTGWVSHINGEKATQGLEAVKSIVTWLDEMATEYADPAGGAMASTKKYQDAASTAALVKTFGDSLAKLVQESFVSQFVKAEKSKAGFEAVKAIVEYMTTTADEITDHEAALAKGQALGGMVTAFGESLWGLVKQEWVMGTSDADGALTGAIAINKLVNMMIGLANRMGADSAFETNFALASASIAQFGEDMTQLVYSVEELGHISYDQEHIMGLFTAILSTIVELSDINSSLDNAGTVVTGMGTIIENLASFYDNGLFKKGTFNTGAAELVGSIVTELTRLAELSTVTSSVGQSIAGIGEMLTAISSLTVSGSAGNDVGKVIGSVVDSIEKALTSLQTVFGESGAQSITEFSASLSDYSDVIAAITELVSSITLEVASLTTDMDTQGEEAGKALSNGLGSTAQTVKQNATILSNNAKSGANTTTASFSKIGENMGSNLASGLNSQAGAAYNAGATVAASARNGVISYVSAFSTLGGHMGQGLAEGLASKEGVVRAAARALANAANEELAKIQVISSPSRVWYGFGSYMGEGLALGLVDSTDTVTDAVAYISNNMLSMAQTLAGQINGILEDPDAQPTITPVLDLSTLQNQAGSIDSIISSNRALSLSGRIAGQMAYNQNGGVQNVVALDPVTIAQIASNQPEINVNFEGSLAQLARVLQPEIVYETNRLGPNLVNE